MGLDNIPKKYPCIGHEIRDEEGKIDCQANQKNGLCTWKNEYESNPLLKESGPTLGMFGTDCWYRGKYGNYLLDLLSEDVPHNYSFYGNGYEDGSEGISPSECIEISHFMRQHAENFAYVAGIKEPENSRSLINDYIYATWWLEFVGNFSDGSEVWY